MELYGAPTARKVVTVIFAYLLSDDACLPLRRAQNSGGEPDGLGDRGQKAKRDARLPRFRSQITDNRRLFVKGLVNTRGMAV
jgi:hypothetical protein